MRNREIDLNDDTLSLLASMAMILNWIPTQDRRKRDLCPPGSPEADDLALTIALSNARKMEMLYQLLAPVLEKALDEGALDSRARELAARIQAENEEIDELGQDYEAIADRLEGIVRDLSAEVHEEHQELLTRAADRKAGS